MVVPTRSASHADWKVEAAANGEDDGRAENAHDPGEPHRFAHGPVQDEHGDPDAQADDGPSFPLPFIVRLPSLEITPQLGGGLALGDRLGPIAGRLDRIDESFDLTTGDGGTGLREADHDGGDSGLLLDRGFDVCRTRGAVEPIQLQFVGLGLLIMHSSGAS